MLPCHQFPHRTFILLACFVVAVCLTFAAGSVVADDELDFGMDDQRLHQIQLNGNKTFSDDVLKSVLQIREPSWKRLFEVPRYKPRLVETQLNLLSNYHRNRGFHQVAVSLDSVVNQLDKGDVLHISIVEGPRTLISKVAFSGIDNELEQEIRSILQLVEGQPAPMDLNAFGGDIFAIMRMLQNRAHMLAKVVPEMTLVSGGDMEGFSAEVLYRIDSGRLYTVKDIRLAGNILTRDNLLTRELVIRTGQPLYWNHLEDSRHRLLLTSLFRDVSIIPVDIDTLGGKVGLEVRVVERKPAYYELGFGVGSRERARILLAWSHRNLRGSGRRLQVRGRGSWNVEDVMGEPVDFSNGQVNYQTAVTFVDPRLNDSRYSFDVEAFLKRETRGESGLNLQIHGLNMGTTWKASRRVTNNVFLGIKVTDPVLHSMAEEEIQERFDETGVSLTQTHSLTWAVYVDHRNDIFRPSSGMYTVGTMQLTGGPAGGDYSFFKSSASWQNYHRFPLGGVLAMRLLMGGAWPYGQSADQGADGIPYDDRFFAGGGSTVRGYDHNSLGPQVTNQDELDYLNYTSDVLLPDEPARGGNYLLLTNMEWRFPLPWLSRWNLGSVLFFEGGNVWERVEDVRMRGFRLHSEPGDPNDPASTKIWDFRYSYGTGLRLDTPIGPVRVDVGFPLKRARYKDEVKDVSDSKMVWHFSLGYPF
ncbi:MAG: BamA/TamA family outer membrane protein [Gemmatimonadales bacterium]|nr:BamA/TamA family outer membrane protein [Gemmatimonadales bacterium]